MLAATNRREARPSDVRSSPLGARVARPVFRAAYKQLCTRIWIELEFLAQARAQVDRRPAPDLVMSTALLRLELIVLVDSCRSPRWRSLLSPGQCDSMCSMLTDVLAALYVDSEYLLSGIAAAQRRVLEELLPDGEVAAELGDSASALWFEAESDQALNELVTLMEAQAAADAVL